jgi:hypothetical protein
MYLTNSKEVAHEYAALRTNDPAARRVFSVKIDTSSLRVLDLRTDSRWLKNLRMIEPSIRMINENYGRAFKDFIQTNKINLNNYDVVIGLEYQRGGTQMCILYRNGQPTALHSAIRWLFHSETTPSGPGASTAYRGPTTAGGRIGAGLKIVGGTAIMLGLSLLAAWLRGKAEKALIEDQMKELEPKIWDGLKKRTAAIAALQSEGRKVFANVTIEHSRMTDHSNQGGGGFGSIEAGGIQGFPVLRLFHINIGPDNVNLEGATEHSSGPATTTTKTRYTYSFEVSVSAEEVDLFRALMAEYHWYENELKKQSNLLLMGELNRVRERIIKAFGPEAARDVLDASMWPKFKYKGKPLPK